MNVPGFLTKRAPEQRAMARRSGGAPEAVAPVLMEYQSPAAALIARPVPAASHFVIWVVAAMAAAGLAAAVLMPIQTVVTAAGKVTATTGNLMAQPLEVSLVRAINVREGQLVHAGEVLAELDPTFAQADAGALEGQMSSLQAEVDRLTAETENRPYRPDGSPASQLQAMLYAQRHAELTFKLENYTQKIAATRVAIAQADSDVVAYTQRLKLASDVEAKRRQLERLQVGSQMNRLQATDTRVEFEARLTTAQSQSRSLRRDLEALLAERDGYLQQMAAETSQQLTTQGRKLAETREMLNKASLRRRLVRLQAQRDGIVLRVAPVSVGTVMQPGDPFIEMVPLDAPLQVEAVVDGRDVGFVRVGDPVTIKFETFPYALHGTATGKLRSVSPDSFKDPTAAPTRDSRLTQAQKPAKALFFRAKISLDEVQLHDLPDGARIVPGMPVQADIRIGTRTMITYMLSRMIPLHTDRSREP